MLQIKQRNISRFFPVIFYLTVFVAGIPVPAISYAAEYTDGALYRENFESAPAGSNWFSNRLYFQNYTTNGIQGKIVQAIYVPTSQGSERIGHYFSLNQSVSSATLSFDVKLHTEFEFVRGGKMHGLGGGSVTTGCDPISPDGWSVRMMWREEGVPILYIYHQDRVSECGDLFYPVNDFKFSRGHWYRVEIYVQMNSGIGTADGRASLYIDGERLVDVTNLNFSGNNSVQIDRFLFSTFYGGSDSSWSPSKNTFAYFDNFTVHPGLRISGDEGTECEIFLEGIFNAGQSVCCQEICGSCGGAGCSALPGGGGNCCTGAILETNNFCQSSGASSPCYFY